MKKTVTVVLVLVLATLAIAAQTSHETINATGDSPTGPTWSHPESRYNLPEADGDNSNWKPLDRKTESVSIIDDQNGPAMGLDATVQSSPGIVLCGGAQGGTAYGLQHNDNNQQMISVLPTSYGGQYVHFTWTHWDRIVDSGDVGRFVAYNCWSQSGGLGLGNCGITFQWWVNPLEAHAGFPNIDIGSDDRAIVALHASERDGPLGAPLTTSPWVFNAAVPCGDLFGAGQFGNASPVEEGEVIWPHLRVDLGDGAQSRQQAEDVFHLVAHPSGLGHDRSWQNQLVYYRRVGGFGNPWDGPVVLDNDAGTINHHVAVDPTSERVAVFYQRDNFDPDNLLQNGYIESPDNGASWIAAGDFPNPTQTASYVPITSYTGPEIVNPQSWVELQGEYDNDGIKHAVWIEQAYANATADCRLKHWDEINGITTIKEALGWNNQGIDGGRDLWLALPNIAFGDGSTVCTDGPGDQTNDNYVYVTYEQYGGPTAAEQSDVSASDNAHNLDIYIAVSNDGGQTFSPSVNLTNTKTPGCDGVIPGNECASERDPSLAHVVNDTIHLMYILDTDAGDVVFGQGNWTFNPVMYYRIPGGTDADFLCPNMAPVVTAQLTNQDPDCEYHAAFNASAGPQQQMEDLIIDNLGNATLAGSVSGVPAVDWLVVTTGSYMIPAGDPPNTRTVTMDASASSVQSGGEGLYQSTIEITHNDTTQPSPIVFPVDFFAFDAFYCPEFATLNTGWLWLTVSNVERQANRGPEQGGLVRLDPTVGDSSYSIYDASLLIGVPPNPDTLVFRNIYGEGNGMPGFRALESLQRDTSAYGTNSGYASAVAGQTTADSSLAIDVEYIFPQHPDSCEFVLIKYRIENQTESTISDLAFGQATDFDIVPSRNDIDSIQPGVQNTGHINPDYNLVYQQGVDQAGHVIVGDRTATRFKGGITAIQPSPVPRAWVAPNEPWLQGPTGLGFGEGYLWQEMNASGIEIFPSNDPDPEEDLHTVMVMENGVSLAPGEVRRYLIGYVSSNTGTDDADLMASVRKAWRYCFGWSEFVTYDLLSDPMVKEYPVYAIGTHEEGLPGGCNGCIFSEVDDPFDAFSLTSNGCAGTITFSGTMDDWCYTATYRVEDLCGEYSDDCVIRVDVGECIGCLCAFQCDFDENGVRDAIDMNAEIDILFFNGPDPKDPSCPVTRADFDANGFSDVLDLDALIKHLFFNGPPPVDPCIP
ncbi:MAG: hypothetical protein GF341_04555 [candidate division Zixibacteria bacterium]|nr:hypothetical protein [candidate division Zixibacteria bacterium]